MIHGYDGNGSPVSEPITNQNGDHIRHHADISHDDVLAHDYVTMAPRYRQLDVRDDHVLELLTGITSVILHRRNAGLPIGLPALEIQAALTVMAAT
jgi:hypothetical protein